MYDADEDRCVVDDDPPVDDDVELTDMPLDVDETELDRFDLVLE